MSDDIKDHFTGLYPYKLTKIVGRKTLRQMGNGTEIQEVIYAATDGKQYKIIAKYDVEHDRLTPLTQEFEI